MRVERVRDFGEVYLALSLWRRLGLDELLAGLIEAGREAVEMGTGGLPADSGAVLCAEE